MKNDMKVRIVGLLLLSSVLIPGLWGCRHDRKKTPTSSPTIDSFFVGTSIGTIDTSTHPHHLTDTIAFSFFQATPPFINAITFDFQTDSNCIKLLGVLPGTGLGGTTTCDGKTAEVFWDYNSSISHDSTTLQFNMSTSTTNTCNQDFVWEGSLVVVLAEVDPQCDAPKIWCRKAIFEDTNGSSTSFRFGINRK